MITVVSNMPNVSHLVLRKNKSLCESHTPASLPPHLLPLQLQNSQYFLSPLPNFPLYSITSSPKWPLRPTVPPCQNHRAVFQSSPPLTLRHHLILLAALSSLKSSLASEASMASQNSPSLNPTSAMAPPLCSLQTHSLLHNHWIMGFLEAQSWAISFYFVLSP